MIQIYFQLTQIDRRLCSAPPSPILETPSVESAKTPSYQVRGTLGDYKCGGLEGVANVRCHHRLHVKSGTGERKIFTTV
ncbi:hypothetical protein EX30DRAFT_77289 [Ascodesmis nigricans]|uniref:Uncharacterized protein n=1 Tax=Ascodesmis nigricans TaxID=341454 RepID=A0A4S2MTK9_9PEZI|nr:hypothetical protein EX30DRAFT_77289 [Ascodesmis nigricans]